MNRDTYKKIKAEKIKPLLEKSVSQEQLTASEKLLIENIFLENDTLNISKVDIIGRLILSDYYSLPWKNIVLNDVSVSDVVRLHDNKHASGVLIREIIDIQLTSCLLNKVDFKQVTINNLSISDTIIRPRFRDSSFHNLVISHGCQVEAIELDNVACNSIEIKNSDVVLAEDVSSEYALIIRKCRVDSVITLINDMVPNKSSVKGAIRNILLSGTISNQLKMSNEILSNDKFADSLVILNSSRITELLKIEHSKLGNIRIGEDCSIKNCEINNVIIEETVDFKDCNISKLFIKNSATPNAINYLRFTNCGVELAYINSSVITSIEFTELLKSDSHLHFSDLHTDSVKFDNFINHGDIRFINLKSLSGSLQMINSDLGKLQLVNCDFRDHWQFEFANTNLLQVVVVGTKLPTTVSIPIIGNAYNLHEQKGLAFGQFRRIYENNHDAINSTFYHSRSLHAIKEFLKAKATKTWKDKADLCSLILNDLSSEFTDSLARAFVVLFVFSVVSYTIFCLLIGFHHPSNDLTQFFRLVAYFPSYLSPIRSNEVMFKDAILNISCNASSLLFSLGLFWDLCSRIIIAYLIYQFIQAFRKYGRKS